MSRIVLADDDVTMRTLLKVLLEMEGHQVELVTDPENLDITSMTVTNQPDLLILDVYLHHQNGIEILKRIVEKRTSKYPKVLMTSGLDLKDECLRSGAQGFLLKPFMPDELLTQINQILSP